MRKCILILLIIIEITSIQAQDCVGIFYISDGSTNDRLEYVNVSYRDARHQHHPIGASDGDGRIETELPNEGITLTFSFIGYKTQHLKWDCSSNHNSIIEIKLAPSSLDLTEIVITDELPPIIQKEDTVIYDADKLRDSTEWKVKELLEKMPGIEVTDENEVLYQGEKIKELQVEGKTFFTGDPSLGVRYIPADAIDEVEIIEKYNKVSFMQGSGDDELVMNLKLKEEKKKLVFGDMEAGTNFDAIHGANSNLFYFSEELQLNSILNYSTSEREPISPSEWFRFLGFECSQYDPKPGANSISRIADLLSLTTLEPLYKREAKFAVGQIKTDIIKNWNIDIIGMGIDNEFSSSQSSSQTTYIPEIIEQNKVQENSYNNSVFLGRYKLSHTGHHKYTLTLKGQFSNQPSSTVENSSFVYQDNLSHSDKNEDGNQHHFWQEVEYLYNFNKKWKGIFQYRYSDKDRRLNNNWLSSIEDKPSFLTSASDTFELNNTNLISDRSNYQLLRFNHHLSPHVLLKIYGRREESSLDVKYNATFQDSLKNTINLINAQYGFDQEFKFTEYLMGTDAQFKIGLQNLTLGLQYHELSQELTYINMMPRQNHSTIRPHLKFDILWPRVGRLKLQYQFQYFPLSYYQNHYNRSFVDINTSILGNPNLLINEVNNFSFHYARLWILKRQSFNANFVRRWLVRPILTETTYEDNQLITSYQNSPHTRSEWAATMSYARDFDKCRLSIRPNFNNTSYRDIDEVSIQLNQWSNKIELDLKFKKLKWQNDLRLFWSRTERNSESSDWDSNHRFTTGLHYKISSSLAFISEISFNRIESNNINDSPILFNSELLFTPAKNKWGVILRAYNIFDQDFSNNYISTPVYTYDVSYREFRRYLYLSVRRSF